jgi:hypothetical protein
MPAFIASSRPMRCLLHQRPSGPRTGAHRRLLEQPYSGPRQSIRMRLRVLLFYPQTLTDLATLPIIVGLTCGSIASLQCLAPYRGRRSVHHNAGYYGRDRDHDQADSAASKRLCSRSFSGHDSTVHPSCSDDFTRFSDCLLLQRSLTRSTPRPGSLQRLLCALQPGAPCRSH